MEKLMELIHAKENFFSWKEQAYSMRDRCIADLEKREPSTDKQKTNEELTQFIDSQFDWIAFKPKVIALYRKYYSSEEVAEIERFLETPTGQKFFKEQPTIQRIHEGLALDLWQKTLYEVRKRLQGSSSPHP